MNQHILTDLAELITDLDIVFSLIVILTAVLGLFLLMVGIKRTWQRRLASAGLSGCCGMMLVLGALLVLSLTLNIHTYHRLTFERPVLTLEFRLQEPKHYQVRLDYHDSEKSDTYELYGDEWQLDARILRWEPPLQILGRNSAYRLERLSGRYRSIEHEREKRRSIHSLSRSSGLDIWSLARDFHHWFPWLDAHYGSATYLPMQDGARYTVSMSQYGLIARPVNLSAREAVFSWN